MRSRRTNRPPVKKRSASASRRRIVGTSPKRFNACACARQESTHTYWYIEHTAYANKKTRNAQQPWLSQKKQGIFPFIMSIVVASATDSPELVQREESNGKLARPAAADDVAALLQATLGAVSTEGRSQRERLLTVESIVAQLLEEVALLRRPARKEVSTQTMEGGPQAFENLQQRVATLEQLMHGGAPHLHPPLTRDSSTPTQGADGEAEEAERRRYQEWEKWKDEQMQFVGDDHQQGQRLLDSQPPPAQQSPLPAQQHQGQQMPQQVPQRQEIQQQHDERGPLSIGMGGSEDPTAVLIAPPSSPYGANEVYSPRQTPAAPMNSPPESRASRPPVRLQLPSMPPPLPSKRESSCVIANALTAPARLRANAQLPAGRQPGLDGPESIMERLQRCEASQADLFGWRTLFSDPLRAEIDSLRQVVMDLANRVDNLSATKMDHDIVQRWCTDLTSQVSSAVSALQDDFRDEKRQIEARLAQAQAQIAFMYESLSRKADREELSQLQVGPAPAPVPATGSEERFRALKESLMTRIAEMMELKADKSELKRLEEALYSHLKPRSATTTVAPLNDRISLMTPLMGAVADARTSALYIEQRASPQPQQARAIHHVSTASLASSPRAKHSRNPPRMQRPASAGKLSSSSTWPPSSISGDMCVAGAASPSASSSAATLLPEQNGLYGGRLVRPLSASPSAVSPFKTAKMTPDRQVTGSDGRLYRQ